MRTALLAWLAVGISLLLPLRDVHAQQQIVFDEDFEYFGQINISYPWATVNSVNAFPWRVDVPYLVFGAGPYSSLYFHNATKTALVKSNGSDSNALLITPTMSFAGVAGAYLKYDSYFRKLQSGGKTERATIEITTNNGATWTTLKSAPVSSGADMPTDYVDLSAYNNVAAARLGFRYSDSGRGMFGWIVDNIKIFVPAQYDIALEHVYPEDKLLSYFTVPSGVSVSGIVRNMGTSPITSFTVNYREGTGAVQTSAVSGVNIGPFDTLSFVHTIPFSIATISAHNLKVWVTLPLDTNHTNDTLARVITGVQFIPQKKLAIEEGTATWNGFGPRGAVYMHALDASDNPPTRISVHASDPMGNTVYKDYLYYLNQNFTPYFLFDRRGPVRAEDFFTIYEQQRNYFGFADIDVTGQGTATHVTVDASVKPALNLTGDYRLALVLTEDDVTGTDTTYNQWNFYAGGGMGAMGGFESLPNPVPAASMQYDYVARSITPTPGGLTGCLPASMTAGQSYSCTFQANLSSAWKRNKLTAVVLLIRGSDSSILNSKTIYLNSLGVATAQKKDGTLQVYPNPASGMTTVDFELTERAVVTIMATDITGRSVFADPAGWMNEGKHKISVNTGGWPSGVYFVSMMAGDREETVKLSVVH